MILIVASTKDIAGMNIAQRIIDHYGFERLSETFQKNSVYSKTVQNQEVKLLLVPQEIIYTQFVTDSFTPQLLVFVSKHSSVSGIPTLSVHTPGNLAEAELGGIPRKVSISPAGAMKDALSEMAKLKEEMGLNYEVSYECTHHGPSLDVPAMFAELGSSLKQWEDLKAAEVVAHAAMAAVSKRSSYPTALGIGGPHYNAKFTKIALSTQTAFGHMIPKYAIPQVDVEIIKQCVKRTMEKVDSAILDWKGIKGADKNRIGTTLDEIGVPIEKV
jgi:D-aminoacyl-tRNA deacylase